jgi:hypothetical protein
MVVRYGAAVRMAIKLVSVYMSMQPQSEGSTMQAEFFHVINMSCLKRQIGTYIGEPAGFHRHKDGFAKGDIDNEFHPLSRLSR